MSDPFQKRDLSQPKNFSLGNLKSFGILILSKEFPLHLIIDRSVDPSHGELFPVNRISGVPVSKYDNQFVMIFSCI